MIDVVTTPEAETDIDEIAIRIARDDLQVGVRFYTALQSTQKLLSRFPNVGTARSSSRPGFEGLRSLGVRGFRNYVVMFIPSAQEVTILRVFHGARDLSKWMNPTG